jgi:hypothetical protein
MSPLAVVTSALRSMSFPATIRFRYRRSALFNPAGTERPKVHVFRTKDGHFICIIQAVSIAEIDDRVIPFLDMYRPKELDDPGTVKLVDLIGDG